MHTHIHTAKSCDIFIPISILPFTKILQKLRGFGSKANSKGHLNFFYFRLWEDLQTVEYPPSKRMPSLFGVCCSICLEEMLKNSTFSDFY